MLQEISNCQTVDIQKKNFFWFFFFVAGGRTQGLALPRLYH
ncbi:rCG63405, isoform CRA_b [Rattus norvegicus]|uniref:RCG63405, isoform CRA_b n=1 Tax=Rattus norvegicus TaxID=10116 RepID=A6II50_RAT|nr:rCG63405, isoform CRA_b [Rattus norvegicus]